MENLHQMFEASFAAERLTTVLQSAQKHAASVHEIVEQMKKAGIKPTDAQLLAAWKLVEKFQDAYAEVEALKRS